MKTKDLLTHCSIDLYALETLSAKAMAPGKAVSAMMKLMRFSTGDKITERDLAIAKAATILNYRDELREHINKQEQVKGMSNATLMNVHYLCDAIESQAEVVSKKAKSLDDIAPGCLFIPKRKSKVTIEALNTWLTSQTRALLKSASSERQMVFKSFFGVNGPAKTQSETGEMFDKPITGERVRRILNDALARFVLPYSEDDMATVLLKMKVVDYELAPFFEMFYDRKGALRCLEYVLGLHKGQLCNHELPKIPQPIIYQVAGATGNAFTEQDLVDEIRRQKAMPDIPDGALPMVVKNGDNDLLSKNKDGTYSASPLPDPYYAAALLYHYPEGVSVNAMAMQSANELDKRVGQATGKPYWANVLVRASTAGLAAISEPGYYKHIRFFEDALEKKDEVLKKTKTYLKGRKGKPSVSLMHEIAPKLFADMDYASVRYVISHLGEPAGIYFKGTSSVDMVSLDPEVPVLDLEDEVKAVLAKRPGPLSRDVISDAIWDDDEEHRPSVYHVIARLEEQNEIVRVGKGLYQSVENAFGDIDIDQAADAVVELVALMHKKKMNVEMYALNAHVNEVLNAKRELPPLWVAGMLKHYPEKFDGKLDVENNVVAKAGTPIKSVNEIGQAILKAHPDYKSVEFVDAMQEKLVIEPKQAAVAYNYLHRKRGGADDDAA